MLLNYHSNYAPQPSPQPAPVWMPLPPARKKPQRVSLSMNSEMPQVEQHSVARVSARARATVALLMLVAHGELDWHYEDEDLLIAGALLLLDDDDC